jgi:hypothetical protein
MSAMCIHTHIFIPSREGTVGRSHFFIVVDIVLGYLRQENITPRPNTERTRKKKNNKKQEMLAMPNARLT